MCEEIIWYMCVPFWLQLIVPALMVIIAVTVTQYIFHRNARARENRERRLLKLEEMISISNGFRELELIFIMSDIANANATLSQLKISIDKLSTLSVIYFPDIYEKTFWMWPYYSSCLEVATNYINDHKLSDISIGVALRKADQAWDQNKAPSYHSELLSLHKKIEREH